MSGYLNRCVIWERWQQQFKEEKKKLVKNTIKETNKYFLEMLLTQQIFLMNMQRFHFSQVVTSDSENYSQYPTMLVTMIVLKFFGPWGKCYVLPEPECQHVHINKENKKKTKRKGRKGYKKKQILKTCVKWFNLMAKLWQLCPSI